MVNITDDFFNNGGYILMTIICFIVRLIWRPLG